MEIGDDHSGYSAIANNSQMRLSADMRVPSLLQNRLLCAVAAWNIVLLAGSTSAVAGDPIRVTDQRGVSITLAKPAQRVVFIPIPAASTYMALDGTPAHIVGLNPIAMTALREGILGHIFPGALSINSGITQGGFIPNVEAILALSPDVVIQWATQGPDAIEPLERAGLPTLGIRYGSQSLTEDYTRMFGALAGKPDRADAIIARQHVRIAAIRAALAGLAPEDRPTVLYFNRFAGDLAVSGADTNNDENIRLAGGINAAASLRGSTQSVTYEQVLQWDPRVILLGTFDPAKPSDLYEDPRWQLLRAVHERRVYRYPLGGYRWDPPSQESAMSWTWLAQILHPDQARQFDLRQDMIEWFKFLYGYALSPAEMDDILNLAENGGSQGYDIFRAQK
jgi:iron complex transport system substrate-binding protein